MKNHVISIFLITFFVSLNSFSQNFKKNQFFEVTVNFGNSQFADALSWSKHYGKRFKVGYGVRLTNYFANNPNYVTAPAKLTSGKESLAALFSENITANFDTVNFTKSQVNFLNAVIYLTYTPPILKDRLDLGMNIDAFGVSVGMKQGGTYQSNNRNAAVSARPTAFNVLLISDSDRGSLNSEWYVRYWVSKKWAIKAGYEFLFTEYKTDTQIQKVNSISNDRFRLKSQMLMVGVTFAPFGK